MTSNLRALRIQAGLLQRDVAHVMECTTSTVSAAEAGRIGTTGSCGDGDYQNSASYATALGMEMFLLDYLAGESDYEPASPNSFTLGQFRRWSGHERPELPQQPATPQFITGLGFKQRTLSTLVWHAGIRRTSELLGMSEDELCNTHNVGAATLFDIKAGLAEMGLRLQPISSVVDELVAA